MSGLGAGGEGMFWPDPVPCGFVIVSVAEHFKPQPCLRDATLHLLTDEGMIPLCEFHAGTYAAQWAEEEDDRGQMSGVNA